MATQKRPLRTPRKSKEVEEVLFTRDSGKRIPLAVRDAADLWLELFQNIAGMTAPDPDQSSPALGRSWLGNSAQLADHALELYETRWPHMGHKNKDGGQSKCSGL
jgi:hypothetical protein